MTEHVGRLIGFVFLTLAIVVGVHINHEQVQRNCAGQVYALRGILEEIHPAPGADEGLIETIRQLNANYSRQYWAIYDFIDGDRCVDLLPRKAPPAPQRVGT